MDIVAHIDGLSGVRVMAGANNPSVSQWISEASGPLFSLALPRWAASDFKEFSTESARAYFTRNKERMLGSFKEHMAASPDYVATLNRHLLALDPLTKSPEAVNGELSEDDIHLFATLRSLSIVRGIKYPPAVQAYRTRMAQRAGVDLHDAIAI